MSLERNLSLMGTYVHIAVTAPTRERAAVASERIVKELEATDAELSTWKSESPLSRINKLKTGSSYKASQQLAADLSEALKCQESTEGLFNPLLGKLITVWKLRDPKSVGEPSPTEVNRALRPRDETAFVVDGDKVTRRIGGSDWEEGGFGKGAALDRALRASVANDVRVVINLGGQLAVSQGAPIRTDLGTLALSIDRGSISTSGHDHRPGHILDPATGRSARNFGQLSVWTDSALRADCLSTGPYVMGPKRAFAWSLRPPDVQLVVRSGGNIYASCALKSKIENQKEVHFICGVDDISTYFKEST
ncbi:MAG: FAD:protein FMN transferase [Bdellovibrionales bacterium]|nr:FAD:protein FMN transferase [Bdellovibrionales bacterium]